MQTDLRVTFHGLPTSAAVQAEVERCLQELEAICSQLVSCRVSIELPHRHQQHGRRFRVGVDVGLPGRHLVGRSSDEDASQEDVHLALRDAFSAVRRQLAEYVRTRRRGVRSHAPGPA
jgi:ribosome-associated translation inhibitor RaiA